MCVRAARPITSGDIEKISARIAEIVKEDRAFTRYESARDAGLSKLQHEGNKYKLDNAERALGLPSSVYRSAKPGGATASEKPASVLTFYATGIPGKNWEDLCRGPHVPTTGRIGAARVMSLASSYWHGDEKS